MNGRFGRGETECSCSYEWPLMADGCLCLPTTGDGGELTIAGRSLLASEGAHQYLAHNFLMCVEYEHEQFDLFDDVPMSGPVLTPGEAWPGYVAPIVTSILPREWLPAMFGLMPHWAKPDLFRSTNNARSETVAEKPSFRNAWKHHQFALIPVRAFYEPNYESGRAVRWRIERADGQPFCVAGIWERRMHDEGPSHWSFSLLTINADEHPLMRRFHKPGDEKRSVVVLDRSDYDGWLFARTEAEARSYLQSFDAELMVGTPDPAPPRSRAKAV